MGFEDIINDIKFKYRTPCNVVKEFYNPLLSRAVTYDRAAGYFSSSVLIEISRGLTRLINRGGKVRIITSPYLQEKDIQAIKEGYDKRKIITEVIMRSWEEPKTQKEEDRLNFLAHMIEEGCLDIKIAYKKPIGVGQYHEKFAILTDENNNSIAFIGSLNESQQAISLNFENIVTFKYNEEPKKVKEFIIDFEETWNNKTSELDVIDFPKDAIDKLYSYKKDYYNKNIDRDDDEISPNVSENSNPNLYIPKNIPTIPCNENFKDLFDYQKEAISNWVEAGYSGIFDMATGTGKTYTGLGALTRLYNDLDGILGVVICCPFVHLVEQWVEDIRAFNIEPIIGYGTSSQNWKRLLSNAIELYKQPYIKEKFFCFICTNDTFTSKFVQDLLSEINSNLLFMVDEAHYFGANKLSKFLPSNFQYRLALSATLERHGDDIGTKKLFDYFGEKNIEYDIERAIREDKLTKYRYYPHAITLDADEMSDYIKLTNEYKRYVYPGIKEIPDAAKMILIKRARLLASARNKITKLEELLQKEQNGQGYIDKNNILVYCGDSIVECDDPIIVQKSNEEGDKQVDIVSRLMGKKLGMDVAQFTSKQDIERRKQIKEGFIKNEYQAIVAIKCLDEGFNIPSIKTAFILASTTNPKQYIQRRGRVLRKFPGKEYAEIYDFVVVPRDLNCLGNISEEELSIEQSLIKHEIERVKEFANISENSSQVYNKFITPLIDAYHLNEVDINVECEYV